MLNGSIPIEILNNICQTRWLKTGEVFQVLRSTPERVTNQIPPKPCSGSWFLVPTSLKRGWKKDNYDYLPRKNGTGMREDVEKLKVQGKPAIVCHYSYIIPSSLESPQRSVTMYRRIYKLIDEEEAKFYFVHYLSADLTKQDISERPESADQSPHSQHQIEFKLEGESIFDLLNEENRSDNWLEYCPPTQNDNKIDVNQFIQLDSDSKQSSHFSPQHAPAPTDSVMKFRIAELERRIDSLEAERLGASTTQHTSQSAMIFPDDNKGTIRITEYSPEWVTITHHKKDFVDGGSKLMLCYQPMIEINHGYILFGDKWSEAVCVQPGVLKCFVPKHEEGCVKLSVLMQGERIDDKNDRPSFFEYRKLKKAKKTQKSGKNMLTDDQSYRNQPPNQFIEGEFKVRVIEKLSSMQGFLQQFQPSSSVNPQMEFETLMEGDDQKTQNHLLELFEMFMRAAERFSVPSDKLTEFLNLADSTGFSLIHYLTALGYQAIIKYLLKFNIDINTIGVDGLTPLQIAILLNKEVPLISIIQNMVSFLIQQGAIDVQQVDPLFQMESIYKNKNILDLLIRGVTLCDSINNSSSVTDQISWNDQEEQEDANYFNLEELCDQIFMEHHLSEPSPNPQGQKQEPDDDEHSMKLKQYIIGQVKAKHHKYYRNYSKQKNQDHPYSDQFAAKLSKPAPASNDNYQDHVKIIQKNVRAWLLRRQYLDMKYATTVLQNCIEYIVMPDFRQKIAKKDFNHPDCKQKIKDTLRNWLNLKQL